MSTDSSNKPLDTNNEEAIPPGIPADSPSGWISPLDVYYPISSERLNKYDLEEQLRAVPPELSARQVLAKLTAAKEKIRLETENDDDQRLPLRFTIAELGIAIAVLAVLITINRLLMPESLLIPAVLSSLFAVVLGILNHRRPSEGILLGVQISGFIWVAILLFGMGRR